jgi:hydrogenase maturation factor
MSIGITNGNAYGIYVISSTLDVASVAANTTAEQTFTVNGLKVGDAVIVNKPSANAGLGVVNARVSAANTIAITFVNATGSGIDPSSESYTIVIFRPESQVAATKISD